MTSGTRYGETQKVFYRPIEAAVRWSGLVRHESMILQVLGTKAIPGPGDFPRWPALRLSAERIYDGLANADLPYGKNGITCSGEVSIDDPNLTVRHVDLKEWMTRFYPDHRPRFLFDRHERSMHPGVSLEAVQALLADREALKVELAGKGKVVMTLQSQLEALRAERNALIKNTPGSLSTRSESTYLNIVGGLVNLMVGQSPGGIPYSSFRTVDSVISALVAHNAGRPGMSERTLWAKFTLAKRHLSATDT